MTKELEWLKSLKLRSDISLGEDGYKYLDSTILKLTNPPLSEKEVLDLLHMYNYGSLFNGHTEDEINFAKHICSHFSKPVIKYPEKKERAPDTEHYDSYVKGWNDYHDKVRKLNGDGGV